jgi:GxxExxY protein
MEPQISQITQIDNKKDSFSYEIIGAAMEVHRELGLGFLEAVYQEAMEIELRERKVPFAVQPQIKLYYKQYPMDKFYKPDFICFNSHIVEIKAETCLTKVDEAQVINTLKATRLQIGLLINFGQPSLKYQRFVYG